MAKKTAERKIYDELLKLHYPPGRSRGKPVSNKVKKLIAAALSAAEASEATTPRLNPRSAASRAAARNVRAEEYIKKLEKQQNLDDLEDALQVQESKRFKGYTKDPSEITVPKRKEAVPVREAFPDIMPTPYEGVSGLTGPELYTSTSKPSTTSPSFDRDKDIFHQIAYGISKLTGQDPSVELILSLIHI